MGEVTVKSNLPKVKAELAERIPVILEAVGLQAEGNAIDEITKMKAVDTGRLRNSITFATSKTQGTPNTQGGSEANPEDYKPRATPEEGSVYIGTNVEYASYIELGARSMAPRPFLKNAIQNHQEEYKNIVLMGLKEGGQ